LGGLSRYDMAVAHILHFQDLKVYEFDMTEFPRERIRNFCVTAHIDHGKTTLSTRLLEIAGTIKKSKQNELYLDKLRVEKERGITVKAQTASLFYKCTSLRGVLRKEE
jgi:translation elongation factor EF-4